MTTRAVLEVSSKRHRDLGRLRAQVACRLHAVLCELVPGGVQEGDPRRFARARILEAASLCRGRCHRPLGACQRLLLQRPSPALNAGVSRTKGEFRQRWRNGAPPSPNCSAWDRWSPPWWSTEQCRNRPGSPAGTPSRPTTAPPRSRLVRRGRESHRLSRRGTRRLNHAVHMTAIPRSGTGKRGPRVLRQEAAEGKTHKEALRASNGGSATPSSGRLRADAAAAATRLTGREGNRGTTLSQRGRLTPRTRLFGKPLPDPTPPYDGPEPSQDKPAHAPQKRSPKPLTQRGLVMHDLNIPFADHLGRAEGLIWRDAASVTAEMWGELGRVSRVG